MTAELEGRYLFPPYELRVADRRVYRGASAVELRPKAFDVLRHLLARRGQLVTKRELLDSCWPDVAVGDAVLKGCIRELRQALDDTADTPRYIETAHRLGYRFLGPESVSRPAPSEPAPLCVGRSRELACLAEAVVRAEGGRRQVCFVSGEPGIGKTTLLRTLLEGTLARGCWRVMRGQCVDQFGAADPYLPILDGLSQLADAHPECRPLLAPVLARAASVASGPVVSERGSLLRPLADVLEALTEDTPLAVWLDDLHWSDHATLALISLLAVRERPCRLLLLASHRSHGDAAPVVARLVHELALKQRAREVELHGLTEQGLADYLVVRLGAGAPSPSLLAVIEARTGGNPMFVERVVDDFLARGWLAPGPCSPGFSSPDLHALLTAVPADLEQLLTAQLGALTPAAMRVLEPICMAGCPLSIAQLASLLADDALAVERQCELLCGSARALARVRTPNGTRYRPIHALLAGVMMRSVPEQRARALHAALGERLAADGEATSQLLAYHFERAGDLPRALEQLIVSTREAAERAAPSEAMTLACRGLAMLSELAPAQRPLRAELALQLALGRASVALRGFGAAELVEVFERARGLAEQLDDDQERARALLGLRAYYAMRDLPAASALAGEALAIGERTEQPLLCLEAHGALAMTDFYLGELAQAEHHYHAVQARIDELAGHGLAPTALGLATNRARYSLVCQLQGRFDEALALSELARSAADAGSDPFQTAWAGCFSAWLHVMREEPERVRACAEPALALAEREGFRYWQAACEVALGVADAREGALAPGIARMRQGIAAWRAIGAQVLYPFLLVQLGSALVETGASGEACGLLDEGTRVASASGERIFESELLRCRALWSPPLALAERRQLLTRAAQAARGAGLLLRVHASRLELEQRQGDASSQRAAERAYRALARRLQPTAEGA